MKSKNFRFWINATSVLISGGVLVSVFGFGCGMGFLPAGYYSSSSVLGDLSDVGDNQDLVIISGKRTVSIAYYDQVLDNMQAMTGVEQLSNTTVSAFENSKAAFSEYGFASSVNAPMLLSFTQVAAEVCGDLIAQEAALMMSARRFFTETDFSANAVNITDAIKANLIRRFARAFWQRNETSDELRYLTDSVNLMLTQATDNDSNQGYKGRTYRRGQLRSAIFLCSTMLSSTSAIEI